MSVVEGLRNSYNVLGIRGVLLTTKARLFPNGNNEASVRAKDYAYPIHVRLRTDDIAIYQQVLRDKQYDWEVGNPKVIVDAGAEIGLASIFFASKFPDARILAIEPEPGNVAMARKNLAPYRNVQLIDCALWKSDTRLSIVDVGSVVGWRVIESPGGAIKTITIENLLTRYNLDFIDVLKLDIEGAEKELFDNCTGWIDRVGTILVELHDRFQPGCRAAMERALRDFPIRHERGEIVYLSRR